MGITKISKAYKSIYCRNKYKDSIDQNTIKDNPSPIYYPKKKKKK